MLGKAGQGDFGLEAIHGHVVMVLGHGDDLVVGLAFGNGGVERAGVGILGRAELLVGLIVAGQQDVGDDGDQEQRSKAAEEPGRTFDFGFCLFRWIKFFSQFGSRQSAVSDHFSPQEPAGEQN